MSSSVFLLFSPGNAELQQSAMLQMRWGEVTLVMLILIAWFVVIGVFMHKWGHIQILKPFESHNRVKPKNIDTIKVCRNQI
jgi:hypothetical protein